MDVYTTRVCMSAYYVPAVRAYTHAYIKSCTRIMGEHAPPVSGGEGYDRGKRERQRHTTPPSQGASARPVGDTTPPSGGWKGVHHLRSLEPGRRWYSPLFGGHNMGVYRGCTPADYKVKCLDAFTQASK